MRSILRVGGRRLSLHTLVILLSLLGESFLVTSASPQVLHTAGGNPALAQAARAGDARSAAAPSPARGAISFAKPHPGPLVLGEQVEVIVVVPFDQKTYSAMLLLCDRGEQASVSGCRHGQWDLGQHMSGPASARVTVTMPNHPGAVELRLDRRTREWHWKAVTIVALPIGVEVGNVPNGVEVPKTVYRGGDEIPITVELPRNRYYSPHWFGVNVRLVPIELEGRVLDEKESRAKWQQCEDCWRRQIGWIQEKQQTGRFTLKPLKAPAQPGRYELRLYDRGSPDEREIYYFASRVITVTPVEPLVAKVLEIKFVRKTDRGFEPVSDGLLRYQEPFAIEVRIDSDTRPDDRQRTVKLERGGGAEPLEIPVCRESARIFRSRVLRLERPGSLEARLRGC